MIIKSDKELAWSTIVANNRMNRERNAIGINSYEKDIKLNLLNFIDSRIGKNKINWIDLYCGKANALIQVSKYYSDKDIDNKIDFKGIDLVDYFNPEYQDFDNILKVHTMNLSDWEPKEKFDLITIVHGLHYVGNKIELIRKAAKPLKNDGLFIGNLDLNNIKLEDIENEENQLKKYFKEEEIDYDLKKKLIRVYGTKNITQKFEYLGANDESGPNYTGQDSVDSIYKLIKTENKKSC